MSKAKETANQIVKKCQDLGWYWAVKGGVLYIFKDIEVGCKEDFSKADSEYYWILSLLPTTRPGSTWGTDGSGVGALQAMNTGIFEMKKSGGNKLVLNQLKNMM